MKSIMPKPRRKFESGGRCIRIKTSLLKKNLVTQSYRLFLYKQECKKMGETKLFILRHS